jgi:putative tricarboxylic transport membrane protein
MDAFAHFASGLEVAFQPEALLFCLLGVVVGTAVGVLPGFGPLAAISLLLPITYHLDTTTALIMLAGIFYGSQYGGSITSILLNIPGEATSAVTCLDGYPMSKQGKAGIALFLTTYASFIGATVGIIMMMVFSPLIAQASLLFSSVEYFSMMLVGLIAAATLSVGSPIKGLIMVVIGLIVGLIGMDGTSGQQRFTFGSLSLVDGIGISAVAMGIFGIGEILSSIGKKNVFKIDPGKITFRSLMPSRADMRNTIGPALRGSWLGVFTGALPGVGISLSPFLAYSIEKKIAKDPSRFGKGASEGIVAPEAANNAAVQAAFIPTMSLGIPGGPTMAIMLGALMIHNLTPGPQFIAQNGQLFWALACSFWIGNILLVILNVPMIGLWVRMLTIPYHMLYPAMIAFICVGSYSIAGSATDVMVVLVFGFVGAILPRYGYPGAPLLLGFILGPLTENNLRRALTISNGDLTVFVTRPLSLAFILLAALLIALVVRDVLRNRTIARETREAL